MRSTPETFQVYLIGGTILSVLLYAAASAQVGPDPSQEGSLALVWLVLPIAGQAQILRKHSGSWFGTPGKRPHAAEMVALLAAYLVGVGAAIWAAHQHLWPLVVLVAAAVGWVAAWASGRWIRRYREEYGYQLPRRLWRNVALYVVFLGVYTMVFAAVWQLLSTWYSHL